MKIALSAAALLGALCAAPAAVSAAQPAALSAGAWVPAVETATATKKKLRVVKKKVGKKAHAAGKK